MIHSRRSINSTAKLTLLYERTYYKRLYIMCELLVIKNNVVAVIFLFRAFFFVRPCIDLYNNSQEGQTHIQTDRDGNTESQSRLHFIYSTACYGYNSIKIWNMKIKRRRFKLLWEREKRATHKERTNEANIFRCAGASRDKLWN